MVQSPLEKSGWDKMLELALQYRPNVHASSMVPRFSSLSVLLVSKASAFFATICQQVLSYCIAVVSKASVVSGQQGLRCQWSDVSKAKSRDRETGLLPLHSPNPLALSP